MKNKSRQEKKDIIIVMMVVRIENHIHTHLSIVMCIQTKSVANGILEMIATRLGAMITIIAIGNTIAQSVITENNNKRGTKWLLLDIEKKICLRHCQKFMKQKLPDSE